MALSSANYKQSFTAISGQTKFDFTLSYFDTTDISVVRIDSDGTYTTLSYNASPSSATQFSVTATNSDTANGATITLGAAATTGSTYVVERTVPYTQQYDLQEGSSIDPTALNKALDRLAAQNQQQVQDTYSGGESVEFPGGLIMKFGALSATSDQTYTITYGTAFPTATISAQATPQVSGDDTDLVVQIETAPTSTQLKVNVEGANSLQKIHWVAFGH